MKITAIALAAMLAMPSWASPAQEAAGDYEVVHIKVKTCRALYQLNAMKSTSGEMTGADAYKGYLSCKTETSREAKAVYTKVLAKLKGADGRRALKEYQAALMSALEGSEPRDEEREAQYRQRISSLDAAVESAWQRLQLEM